MDAINTLYEAVCNANKSDARIALDVAVRLLEVAEKLGDPALINAANLNVAKKHERLQRERGDIP